MKLGFLRRDRGRKDMSIKINELSEKKKGGSTPVSLGSNNVKVERIMLIDSHEPVDIVDKFKQKGINVGVERLSSGDFIFSNIGIERKTLTDFWGSITSKDKRIWRQMFELKRNFERPFLVIERFNFAFLRSPTYSKQIWGTIASIALLGINVVTIVSKTGGSQDFIDFVSYLYFSADPNKKTSRPLPKKSKKPKEVFMDCLCMVPGIGPGSAKKIVGRYTNWEELCEVTREDLSRLCGKSRVKLLWRVLHGEDF